MTSRTAPTKTATRHSIAVKLYSIFALFALLTAAITWLSDYNSRRAAELTKAIETANLAALNVQVVNGLVYAVVMESRGVYMSTDPAVVKRTAKGCSSSTARSSRSSTVGRASCRPTTPSNSQCSRSAP